MFGVNLFPCFKIHQHISQIPTTPFCLFVFAIILHLYFCYITLYSLQVLFISVCIYIFYRYFSDHQNCRKIKVNNKNGRFFPKRIFASSGSDWSVKKSLCYPNRLLIALQNCVFLIFLHVLLIYYMEMM